MSKTFNNPATTGKCWAPFPSAPLPLPSSLSLSLSLGRPGASGACTVAAQAAHCAALWGMVEHGGHGDASNNELGGRGGGSNIKGLQS